MVTCFISYRREDSEDVAQELYTFLLGRFGREAVFWDRESIPVDTIWQKVIRERIEQCDVVLALVGPRWLELLRRRAADSHDHLRFELEYAHAVAKPVLVLPVLGAAMPGHDALPPELRFLAEQQSPPLVQSTPRHQWLEDLADRIIAHVPARLGRRPGPHGGAFWWSSRAGARASDDPAWWTEWNFHDREMLDAITDGILGRGDTNILALRGPAGCGRRYALDAAVHRVRSEGEPVWLARLDLDGYEPGPTALRRYLAHQATPRGDDDRLAAYLEWIAPVLGPHAATLDACAAIGVLYDLTGSLDRTRAVLERCMQPHEGRTVLTLLGLVLGELAREGRLVVHVLDQRSLTEPLREALLAAAARSSRLVLVFSCFLDEPPAEIGRGRRVRPIAIEPLNTARITAILEDRFGPHPVPARLAHWLERLTQGRVSRLVAVLQELLRSETLTIDRDGWWLPPATEDAVSGLQHRIADVVLSPIARLYRRNAHLQTVLEAAALCGSLVPLQAVCQSLGLDDDATTAIVDLVDDELCEPAEHAIFRDHAFRHPGLPHTLAYEFLSSLIPEILRASSSADQRADMATRLLTELTSLLPATTRAVALIHLSLLRHLPQQGKLRADWERRLAWWIGIDEADELARSLAAQLDGGSIHVETLWNTVVQSEDIWPAFRRLALLDVYRSRADVPFERMTRVLKQHAYLLHGVGRYADGELLAREGLQRLDPDTQEAMPFHYLLALMLNGKGDFAAGHHHAQCALSLAERFIGVDDRDTIIIALEAAVSFGHVGIWPEAASVLRDILERAERVCGPDDSVTLNASYNLGCALKLSKDLGAAEPLLRRAAAGFERLRGCEHSVICAWHDLACVLTESGSHTEAEELHVRALDAAERILGPEHPETLAIKSSLGTEMWEQGRIAEAESILRDTLEVEERILGPRHPTTLVTTDALALTRLSAGDIQEAELLFRRSLDGRIETFGPEHRQTAEGRAKLEKVQRALGYQAGAEAAETVAIPGAAKSRTNPGRE